MSFEVCKDTIDALLLRLARLVLPNNEIIPMFQSTANPQYPVFFSKKTLFDSVSIDKSTQLLTHKEVCDKLEKELIEEESNYSEQQTQVKGCQETFQKLREELKRILDQAEKRLISNIFGYKPARKFYEEFQGGRIENEEKLRSRLEEYMRKSTPDWIAKRKSIFENMKKIEQLFNEVGELMKSFGKGKFQIVKIEKASKVMEREEKGTQADLADDELLARLIPTVLEEHGQRMDRKLGAASAFFSDLAQKAKDFGKELDKKMREIKGQVHEQGQRIGNIPDVHMISSFSLKGEIEWLLSLPKKERDFFLTLPKKERESIRLFSFVNRETLIEFSEERRKCLAEIAEKHNRPVPQLTKEEIEYFSKIQQKEKERILQSPFFEKEMVKILVMLNPMSQFSSGFFKQILSDFSSNPKLELLFQGSKHGFSSSQFHTLCNGKGPTLTLIRNDLGYLFGAFTSLSWNSNGSWYSDSTAFLFSFDLQKKFTQFQNQSYAVYMDPNYGPTFGNGHDIYIASDCNSNTSSHVNMNTTYSLNDSKLEDMRGSNRNFRVEDYAVYKVLT